MFAHAIDGAGSSAATITVRSRPGETVLFGPGGRSELRAGAEGMRFLLVSGRPLHEPVAWYGPIVMNTPAQLTEAVRELRSGGFVKDRRPIVEE